MEKNMKKTILLMIITIYVFAGCATWKGMKKDSSDAWDATKDGSETVYKKSKKAVNEAFE